jgi:hypothetical protein
MYAYLNRDSTCRAPEPTVWYPETSRCAAVLFLCWDCANYHSWVAELLWPWICETLNHPDTCHSAVGFPGILDDIFVDEPVIVLCECMCCSHCSITDEDMTYAHREHCIYS